MPGQRHVTVTYMVHATRQSHKPGSGCPTVIYLVNAMLVSYTWLTLHHRHISAKIKSLSHFITWVTLLHCYMSGQSYVTQTYLAYVTALCHVLSADLDLGFKKGFKKVASIDSQQKCNFLSLCEEIIKL